MRRDRLSLRSLPLKSARARPLRTMILALLALAQTACALTGLLLVQSTRAELSLARDRLGADVVVYPSAGFLQLDKSCIQMVGSPVLFHKERSTLSRLNSNEDIDRIAYQLYLSDATGGGEPLWIIGFDPASDFVVAPWLREGPDHVVPEGSVAVGADVAVSREGTVTLFGEEWPVDSHLERIGAELDKAVFVPIGSLERVIAAAVAVGDDSFASLDPHADYSVALLRLKERSEAESVTNWINLYVRRVTAVHSEEALVGTASSMSAHSSMLAGVAALTWLILLGALAVAQWALFNERRREANVWRILGASRALVERVLLREALMVHASGALLGALVAAGLVALIGVAPVRSELVSPGNLAALAATAVAMSLLVAWIGARAVLPRLLRAADDSMLLTT